MIPVRHPTASTGGLLPPVPTPGISTVSERTFTFADPTGDLGGIRPGGFFADDVRHLSKLDLRIDGDVPELVDVVTPDADTAVFCLRVPGHDDPDDGAPGLIVRRTRRQSHRFVERISVENRTRATHAVAIDIAVDADFARMLDLLLNGGPAPVTVTRETDGRTIRLRADDLPRHSTAITVDGHGVTVQGQTFHARPSLAPGQTATLTVDVTAQVGDSRPPPTVHHDTPDQPRLASSLAGLDQMWHRSHQDLRTLEHELLGHRVLAAGIPWFVTLFGRDSLIAGLQTLLIDRRRALSTARVLAELQGRRTDPVTGEEPGKILHEVRHARTTSGDATATCYYETVDATSLFCLLVDRLHRWGIGADEITPLATAVRHAADWIVDRCRRDGLLYYEHGATRLVHHGWKDSRAPILDASGEPLTGRIAVVEAQGYAVAALRAAARLNVTVGDGNAAGELIGHADELQDRIAKTYWCDHLATMAMAADADGRRADVASSNPGHLLWSGAVSHDHATAIVASLRSADLWTGWGIRTLGRTNPAYNPMAYHRGTVWPHDTAIAAAGMLRYGHDTDGVDVFTALLSAGPQFGYQLPELFCGFDRTDIPRPVRFPTSSAPQAWAAGVPVMAVEQLLGVDPQLDQGIIRLRPRLPDDHRLDIDGIPVPGGTLAVTIVGDTVVDAKAPDGIKVIET